MTPAERSELAKALEVMALLLHEVRALVAGVVGQLEQLRDQVDDRGGS